MWQKLSEWKLFKGKTCEFATAKWYKEREAAHHLEQYGHGERIQKAFDYTRLAMNMFDASTVVDLGCGDGGFLSLLKSDGIGSWGYDLQPQNIDYAVKNRGVDARLTDFSKASDLSYGDIVVMTEVLEHLIDPHGTLKKMPGKYLIVSSPYGETGDAHYEFHLWAWDLEGYRKLVENAGYKIILHDVVWLNQIILAERV
jgi:SAM-dependent methyltransferase